jgi:hypothetical protein
LESFPGMKFVCDAPGGKTWFRIETEGEALQESEMMQHAVEKYFRREWEKAVSTYKPPGGLYIEQEIGLKRHIQATMSRFLTLRDEEGACLATAMVPPESGAADTAARPIVVGRANADPYPEHSQAIGTLARHLGVTLDRERCYPYRRG